MKNNIPPYNDLKGQAAWAVVENAIKNLVKNKDLIEQTARDYIVGYLIKQLSEQNLLRNENNEPASQNEPTSQPIARDVPAYLKK